jgi:hypothetical protein
VNKTPQADEIRQYKTSDLDTQIELSFQSLGKLKENPNLTTIEDRNRELWFEYLNLLLRIADARPASRFYHWFDKNALDETLG